MEIEKMSCIDCAVKNCDKEDKAFPEFCVTTHLNQEVLQDADPAAIPAHRRPQNPAVSEPAGESAEAGSEAAQGDSQAVSEESGTLRMYGPGAFLQRSGKTEPQI